MKEYIDKSKIEYPYMTMTLWGLNQATCHAYNEGVKATADTIAAMPAADVVERKRGEWVDISCVVHDPDGDWIATQYQCSLCGRKEYRKEPFCNCGADMRQN